MPNEETLEARLPEPGIAPAGFTPVVASSPVAPPPFYLALLDSARSLLRQNPALGLTLGYLFLTAVGMTYEWIFFKEFDLLIFSFAEPSDFLLVPIREPVLLGFTVLSVLVMVKFVNKRSKRLAKRPVSRLISLWLADKPWRGFVERLGYLAVFIGYFLSLTSIYANFRAKLIHEGAGTRVRVELISDPAGKSGARPLQSYLLLGTTGKYLLVYNPGDKTTEALPVNNIARLVTEK